MRVSCRFGVPSAAGVTPIHPVTVDSPGELQDRMTCEHCVERVTDYLEDALDDGEHERFEEHLAQCPECQVHLERMRALIRELGALHTRDIRAAGS
jgi:hypothetical protein